MTNPCTPHDHTCVAVYRIAAYIFSCPFPPHWIFRRLRASFLGVFCVAGIQREGNYAQVRCGCLKLLPETAFRSEDCCGQHQRARRPALVLKAVMLCVRRTVHLKIKEFAAAIAWTYQCFRRTVHLEINEFNLLLQCMECFTDLANSHANASPMRDNIVQQFTFIFLLQNQIYML